jgi:hypothetical protein
VLSIVHWRVHPGGLPQSRRRGGVAIFWTGCQDVFADDGSDNRLLIKGLKTILPTWQDIFSILQSSQPAVMLGKDVVEEPDPANPPKEPLSHCSSSAIQLAS